MHTCMVRTSIAPIYANAQPFSELMLEGILVIGPKFASWGVELDKGDSTGGRASTDEDGLFIPTNRPDGPDAPTAQAFITDQVGLYAV